MRMSWRQLAGLMGCLLTMHPGANATESGAIRAVNGAAASEIASPQFPGWYGQFWVQHYRADKLRDEQGRSPALRSEDSIVGPLEVQRQARIRATVGIARATWLSEMRWGEGKFGVSLTLPFAEVDQQVKLGAALPASFSPGVRELVQERLDFNADRASGKRRGIGDLELMPYFDWQTDEYRLAVGLGVVAPTGDYDAGRDFNIGAGKFWSLRPLLVYGRALENGLQLGLRATYTINQENRDTGNRSGQYLAMDFGAHYNLNDQWRLGGQGFVNWQTTQDRCADPDESRCGKVRVFGVGPVLAYTSESGIYFADFKILREFGVRNRPEGTMVWLRLNVRLDQ